MELPGSSRLWDGRHSCSSGHSADKLPVGGSRPNPKVPSLLLDRHVVHADPTQSPSTRVPRLNTLHAASNHWPMDV